MRCPKLSGARPKKSFNGMADYSQGGGMGEWKIVGLEGPAHCQSLYNISFGGYEGLGYEVKK